MPNAAAVAFLFFETALYIRMSWPQIHILLHSKRPLLHGRQRVAKDMESMYRFP